MIDFNAFIQYLMSRYKYTQGQFSIISGANKMSVYRWCNNLAYPDSKIMSHIIYAYPDDFIEWLNNYIEFGL